MKFLIEPVVFYADSESCFPDIPCIDCAIRNSRTVSENYIRCVATPVS